MPLNLAREQTAARPFVVFDALQLSALFLSIVTVLPAICSKSVYRMKTWFALMISCIFYCVSFLLLLGQQSGKSPAFSFCLFQASLIYAAPAMVAATGFGFVVELYLRLSFALNGVTFNQKKARWLLVLGPAAHTVVFWVSILNGTSNISKVERVPTGMYCHINDSPPTLVAGVSVVLLLALMIIIELYTIFVLIRRRRSFRGLRAVGQSGLFPVSLFIRTASFTLLGGLGIIMADVFINSTGPNNAASLDVFAIIPLAVALTFGSQLDILRSYVFWKKGNAPASEQSLSPIVSVENQT